MKPIEVEDLASMVEGKRFLLLKKSYLGLSFIDMLIHRSPNSIATKKSSKRFPLEIWLTILEFAVCDDGDNEWYLVQLQCTIENGRYLLCKLVGVEGRQVCGGPEGVDADKDEHCLSMPKQRRPEGPPLHTPDKR